MEKVFLTFSLVIIAVLFTSCTNSRKQGEEATDNNETEMTSDEWITLFDGKSFDGWRGYGRQEVPTAWTIDDGAIKINGSGRGEAGAKDGGTLFLMRNLKTLSLLLNGKLLKEAIVECFILPKK